MPTLQCYCESAPQVPNTLPSAIWSDQTAGAGIPRQFSSFIIYTVRKLHVPEHILNIGIKPLDGASSLGIGGVDLKMESLARIHTLVQTDSIKYPGTATLHWGALIQNCQSCPLHKDSITTSAALLPIAGQHLPWLSPVYQPVDKHPEQTTTGAAALSSLQFPLLVPTALPP
jgi:hypothetical protein